MKRIFPAEIVEFTAEHHFHEHDTRSRVIYRAVLLFMVLGFGSLFLIRVEVGISSSGMVRAETERNTIKASVSGRVGQVLTRENQAVAPGDTLLTVHADVLEEQSAYVSSRRQELSRRIGDLRQLTVIPGNAPSPASGETLSLKTPLYTQQYNLFKQQLTEAALTLDQAHTRYERQKALHEQGVISDAEFDQDNYELKNAQARLRLVRDEQISRWQTEQSQLKEELRELASQGQKFEQEREFYTVTAPAGGVIQRFSGIRPGSYVSVGETLAELSPDSGLIAQVQVLPRDIGLLREGMPVRFQVDAFNYNEWGVITGQVSEISGDVLVPQEGAPVFLVKCRLDTHTLRLPSGHVGTLKKGMTLQARFLVARRTLFQLLYDKADDWLNPGVKREGAAYATR